MLVDWKKSDLYEEIRRVSSYVGSKLVTKDDPNAYERVRIGVDDEEIVDTFLSESISDVTTSLRTYITHLDESADTYSMVLNIPENADTGQTDVKACITGAIKNLILFRWFTFTAPAVADSYSVKALQDLDLLKAKLGSRTYTKRDDVTSRTDTEVETADERDDGCCEEEIVIELKDAVSNDIQKTSDTSAELKDAAEEEESIPCKESTTITEAKVYRNPYEKDKISEVIYINNE